MTRRRIVVFVSTYPQVSETYIKNEVDALAIDHEIELVTFAPGSYPYRSRRPHIVVTRENQGNVLDYLQRFRPHALHAHYLVQLPQLVAIAHRLQVPFTVRAHSFDVLGSVPARGQAGAKPVPGLAEAARSPLSCSWRVRCSCGNRHPRTARSRRCRPRRAPT